ncbi:MAG: fatty acid desaturase [Oscillatoriales cyanobacterium SM2_2_1]|nr:fatty acid desaturase [Oscillatoriales cyanobacterium SM2_2_1]
MLQIVSATTSSSALPFTLAQLKAAIPASCFVPSTGRSLAYFFADLALIVGLYALAAAIDQWWFYPIFWLATGTLFWSLFVVGHDCGHGSFSRHRWLNNLIGHLSHTPILVPFHGWRISHRTHHQNTGNIDHDESWYPITEDKYRSMGFLERLLRYDLALLVYPLYLFRRSPSREGGSHFLPESPIFQPGDRADIITSTICWALMFDLLVWVGFQFGFVFLLKFYLVPYVIFVIWLDLVTFLHHTEADVPWYRGQEWSFLRGALSTVDRDYGFINDIHHNIGTHVAHHIFSTIPHYHLKTATAAIKPILGDFYRVSSEPVWQSFGRSQRQCHWVPDQGTVVYYQPKS